MLIWLLYERAWTLAVGGAVVGYLTNWLALKLIFEPVEPTRFGPWVVQGGSRRGWLPALGGRAGGAGGRTAATPLPRSLPEAAARGVRGVCGGAPCGAEAEPPRSGVTPLIARRR